MRIDYELTLEDVWAYEKIRRKKYFLFKPYALLIGPGLALFFRLWSPSTTTYFGLKGQMTQEVGGFWTDFLSQTIFFTGLILLYRHGANQQLKNQLARTADSWKGPRSMEFLANKVVGRGKYMVTEVDPAYVKRVDEGPHHVFLMHDEESAWIIPKRFLSPNVDAQVIRTTLGQSRAK